MLKEKKKNMTKTMFKENTTRNKANINKLIFFTKGAHTVNRKNKHFAAGLEL